MADITWPVSLPDHVQVSGYSEDVVDNSLETQTDAGPPMKRRIAVAGAYPLQCQMLVTKAQRATLKTFFETTSQSGVLPFDWTHPVTGDAVEAQFVKGSAPKFAAISGQFFRVSFVVRVLP